jgi:adenine-specific DNA-methyltransferase
MDPFMGSGTSGIAAILEGRKFIGSEINKSYYEIAASRIQQALEGTIKIREDKPVSVPDLNTDVAKLPKEFAIIREKIKNGQK